MKGEWNMKLTWDFTGNEYQLLELETNKTLTAIKYNGQDDSYSCSINGVEHQLDANDITEAKKEVTKLLFGW